MFILVQFLHEDTHYVKYTTRMNACVYYPLYDSHKLSGSSGTAHIVYKILVCCNYFINKFEGYC